MIDKNKEFITVKEYANIKGVSVSSVYKRLNTSLQPFVYEVDGKKVLKINVLEFSNSTPLQPNSSTFQPFYSTPLQPLNDELDMLKDELKAKNDLIKDLLEQVKIKDNVIIEQNKKMQEQTDKLMQLLEQSNTLNYNNQLLISEKQTSEDKDVEKPKEEKKNIFRKLFKQS